MKLVLNFVFILYLNLSKSYVDSSISDRIVSLFYSHLNPDNADQENDKLYEPVKISFRRNQIEDDGEKLGVKVDGYDEVETRRREEIEDDQANKERENNGQSVHEFRKHGDLLRAPKNFKLMQNNNRRNNIYSGSMLLPLKRELMGKNKLSNNDLVLKFRKENGLKHDDKTWHNNFRRLKTADSSAQDISSSLELKNYKEELHDMWLKKKFEALNQTVPKGDAVNMVAARPWGVPCGDPNQHDTPWGTCMLSMECEAEYRIYRGDYFCGRTQFVCCALQLTNYDLYQGFELSLEDSSLSTDSDEKKRKRISNQERKQKKKDKERKQRRKARRDRKKKIRENIKKIIREIRKILSKQFKNATSNRKKKTRQLKKFIKELKKKYKKERQSVKDLHAKEMIRIDNDLMVRLKFIRDMNNNFIKNSTFRDIISQGTVSKQGARMLVEAYPELNEFLETRRHDIEKDPRRKGTDNFLDYDIEYGYLYY